MKVLQGNAYFFRFNIESNLQARQMFEETIALDPKNATAYTMLAWTHMMEVWFGWNQSPDECIKRATELAQKALALNDTLDSTHSLLGNIFLIKRQYDKAVAEAEGAVALNPNGADAHAHLGMILHYVGRPEEAIVFLKKATRLNPLPPNWYLFSLGHAYRMKGRYDEAIAVYRRVLDRNPDDMVAHAGLTATYSLSGRMEEARAEATEVLRLNPKSSLDHLAKTIPFKNQSDIDSYINALRKAGLK